MAVSYKQALNPRQQVHMELFLSSLSNVYQKAKSDGMGKPNMTSFIDEFSRQHFGRINGWGGDRKSVSTKLRR